jgi:hypothetical protein
MHRKTPKHEEEERIRKSVKGKGPNLQNIVFFAFISFVL